MNRSILNTVILAMIGIILVGATVRNPTLVLPDGAEGKAIDKHAQWDFSNQKESGKVQWDC